MSETEFEYYKDQWGQTQKSNEKNYEQLDKIIFVISTGLFVLSINILFARDYYFIGENILYISWILIFISIFSQIFSYRYSISQTEDQMKCLDEAYLSGGIKNLNSKKIRIYSKQIKFFNDAAVFSLITGMALMLSFAYINFKNINEMNMEKEKKETKKVEKHAAPNPIRPFREPKPEEKPKDCRDEKK